jgi:hypothetical protein
MSDPTAFTVVTRHRVQDFAAWLPGAREALAPLASQSLCLGADICASIDDPNLAMVVTRWASIGDHRRAMSSFEVKMHTVPMLSQSLDEPSAYEVLHHHGPDGIIDSASARAHDADSVGLGSAAAEHVDGRIRPA